jgi:hypothetical protein
MIRFLILVYLQSYRSIIKNHTSEIAFYSLVALITTKLRKL